MRQPMPRLRQLLAKPPLWSSFGTAERRSFTAPATLSDALGRRRLVYPLASLDVSGQWPVSCANASPNEVSVIYQPHHTPVSGRCQGVSVIVFLLL